MTERHPTANKSQRDRRARNPRIDYYPSPRALFAIDSKRGRYYPLNTNSGVLDAIVCEWAGLTGIKYRKVESPKTSAGGPELSDDYARAYDFGVERPEYPPASRAPTHAERSQCGAKRHRDGQPCQSRPEPGKYRCRFHGGKSTGPRTEEGKARSLANLRQARVESMG